MARSARQVVEQHMAAVREGDLDAIVAGYAPDAVHADAHRIGQGHEYVRAVHAEALAAAADLDPELEVLDAGDVVFVTWRATAPDGPPLVGTTTFVVAGGLIRVSTTFMAAGATNGRRLVAG